MNGVTTLTEKERLYAVEGNIASLMSEIEALTKSSIVGHGEIINHGKRLEVDKSMRLTEIDSRISTNTSNISSVTANVSALGIDDLSDPGFDRIVFWDESADALKWLQCGDSIAITGTTIDTIQDIRTTASPTFVGLTLSANLDMQDDKKILLGTGDDGEIYVNSDNLYIKNITQDKDIILSGDDGGVTKTITWDLDVDKLKHSAGTFDFDNDHITTTGTITGGTLTDGTFSVSSGTMSGISDLGTVGTADIDGGTLDGVTIATDCTQTEWDAAYTHVSNDGTDHGYIDQDVQTTASPTFDDLTISGHIGLGGAAVHSERGLSYIETYTITDNNGRVGIRSRPQFAKTSAAYTSNCQATYSAAILDATNTQNWTNSVGLRGIHVSIGTSAGSSGTITGAAGIAIGSNVVDAATITNLYGVIIFTPTVAGSKLTNEYGIYIEDQNTGDTLNYAIYTGTGLVRFGDAVSSTGTITGATLTDGTFSVIGGAITGATNTEWDAAYTHVSNDGSDHSLIDQSVISGASPTFDGTNFTGIPSAGVTDNVSASAVITDHTIVRGHGGAKVVQDSGIVIDDSDNVSSMGTLGCGAITSTGIVQCTQLGIGRAPASSTYYIDLFYDTVNTSQPITAIRAYITKTAGSTNRNDNFIGADIYMSLNQNGAEIGHFEGLYGRVELTDGNVGSTTYTKHVYGLLFKVDLDGGKVWGNAYASWKYVDQAGANEVTGDIYGDFVQIDADGTTGGLVYMFYARELSNVDYCFYQNGSAAWYIGTSQFGIPNLASGANQGASGAAAGELWHDTTDDTIKMGV